MILITGSKGQLGSALALLLDKKGISYKALGKDKLDITNLALVYEVIESLNPHLVINCAAYNEVDQAEERPYKAIAINALGVRNLALACEKRGIVLMHISTDYVFSGRSKEPYTISHQPNPINSYGRSKLLGERFVEAFCSRFYIVRVSWVFGKGKRNFLYKLLNWAKDKDNLKIVNDQISAPSYAPHLAEALFQLSETGAYGLYHLHNSGRCSRYEWAEYSLKKVGWKGELEPVASDYFRTLAKRPAYSVLDLYPLDELIEHPMPTWKEATDSWLYEEGYL